MLSPFLVSPAKTHYPIPPLPAHQPNHSCFLVLAFPYNVASNILRTKGLSSLCPTRPSSAIYEAGAMGPWEHWVCWLVHIDVPPMELQAPLAPWILSLAPHLETLCSLQWLAESIYLCYMSGTGKASQETAKSGSCQQALIHSHTIV